EGADLLQRVSAFAPAASGLAQARRGGGVRGPKGDRPAPGRAALQPHVRRQGARHGHHPTSADHDAEAGRGVPAADKLRSVGAELHEALRDGRARDAGEP
ncbi:uncharacterized protein TRAVEDRAFT_111275, partial [Trametes versicolor FP-101664 SS1]|uniref:uncharacterized protein n=1 Tax=Trametes versicolor (strain FP-101664) TaxID=717944 RepID=UPI0004623322